MSGTAVDCRAFVELVTAYLEGALDDRITALVEEHLDLCHPCIVYLDQVRHTVTALNRLPLEGLPPAARDELLAAFRAARGS
jgi:predicted anti-sigma-YlaC factor YlaD